MKKFSDDKYTKIAILTVITVAASYLAILILGQSGSLLMGLLSLLAWIFDVVTPLILGLVFAYILLPVVNVFDKLLGRLPLIKDKPGLCRGISIFTTLFSLFLVIFILLSLVISTITSNIHFISFEDLRLMAEYIGVQASNLYNEIRDNLLRYDIAIPDTDTLLKSARHQITSIDGKKGSNIAQVFGTGLLGAFNFVKNIVVLTLVNLQESSKTNTM